MVNGDGKCLSPAHCMAWLAQRCISLFGDEPIEDHTAIHGVHSMIDDDQWESGGGIDGKLTIDVETLLDLHYWGQVLRVGSVLPIKTGI